MILSSGLSYIIRYNSIYGPTLKSQDALASLEQRDSDGSGQRSCKCNYVDFYKDARPRDNIGIHI